MPEAKDKNKSLNEQEKIKKASTAKKTTSKKKSKTQSKKKSNSNNNAKKKDSSSENKKGKVLSENIEENKKEIKEENLEEITKTDNSEVVKKKKIKGPKKETITESIKNDFDKNLDKEQIVEEKKEEIVEDEHIEKSEDKKDLITSPQKEVIKVDEKPEYVQEMIKKRKKTKFLIGLIILTILMITVFSTIFAILNTNNSNIINGVTIKNLDVSGLSKEAAIEKITEAINKELIAEINLEYGDEYKVSIKPEQIEFKYEINEIVDEAYQIGRNGNVLRDNYSILYANIFGKELEINYNYNGDLLNQFIEDVNSKIPGVVVEPTYYIEDNKLFVNKGIDGIKVKSEELKNEIIKSIFQRNASQMTEDFNQTIKIPIEEANASEINMEKIYLEIYQEPKDAYYETEPYKIYPDVDGIDLMISVEEAQNLVEIEDKQEYVFDLKITEAEKTLDELGTEAFPYLISQFSTKYDASNRNRSTNLELAAQKINGKVLMPGDEFSFNKIVGKRTVEAGYKDAAIYADGGVVDGLAGGICQISSTLYNSVLLANLQITERRNHSFTTSYAPAGKDATVVWGTTDFRFINSRSYPVKIEATVRNGIAEFKIYGMQEETEYEVRILPIRTQSIPYTTTYEEDPSLMPGQQIVKQAGHAGCKVTTYKELRLNGEVVSKEPISNDTYQPMRTIIRVAPGHIPVQ